MKKIIGLLILIFCIVNISVAQKFEAWDKLFTKYETPAKERVFLSKNWSKDLKNIDFKMVDKFLKTKSVANWKSKGFVITKKTYPLGKVTQGECTLYFYVYTISQTNMPEKGEQFAGYLVTSYVKNKFVEENLLSTREENEFDVQLSDKGDFRIHVLGPNTRGNMYKITPLTGKFEKVL